MHSVGVLLDLGHGVHPSVVKRLEMSGSRWTVDSAGIGGGGKRRCSSSIQRVVCIAPRRLWRQAVGIVVSINAIDSGWQCVVVRVLLRWLLHLHRGMLLLLAIIAMDLGWKSVELLGVAPCWVLLMNRRSWGLELDMDWGSLSGINLATGRRSDGNIVCGRCIGVSEVNDPRVPGITRAIVWRHRCPIFNK